MSFKGQDGHTIAAVSTPNGVGGIGIVRVSGPDVSRVVEGVFCPTGRRTPLQAMDRRVIYGTVVGPDGSGLDECLCLVMLAPRSYTGEDVVEFQCHGGTGSVSSVLRAVLSKGVRLAEPGEFTKRAFVNGRLDLTQAEAVGELVRARTERAASLAMRQLEGRLGNEIRRIRSALVSTMAEVEASIDFPDDVAEVPADRIVAAVQLASRDLGKLVGRVDEGRLYRVGAMVAILGRPNVGKSSLLNSLLGHDRAIVTDVAGTTRDVLEETINIHGIPVRLVDTAGIREAGDAVETIGVERAVKAGAIADVVLLVIDGSCNLSAEDASAARAAADRAVILVVNKTDLPRLADVEVLRTEFTDLRQVVDVSAKDGTGLEDLLSAIEQVLKGSVGAWGSEEDPVLATVRQQEALHGARDCLNELLAGVSAGMPQDLVCVDLRGAIDELSRVTGEGVADDVIESVFADFCVGK